MLIDGCQQLGYHVRVAPNNMIQSAVSEKDRGEGESVVFCFDISLISILHRDFFFFFCGRFSFYLFTNPVGVGDRHGLKQSMVETYLKDAFRTGNVDLLDETEAEEILHKKSQQEEEEGKRSKQKNRSSSSSSRRQQRRRTVSGVLVKGSDGTLHEIFANVVVVSGGSLNSPALLLRTERKSSECDFNESGMLGRNLRLHPVVGIMALAPHVVDIWNGAPMTTVSEEVGEMF